MTERAERLEARRAIAAEPAAIFAVLTDPAGHVAIDSSGMLMSATGVPVRAVGDTFVVHMDREALGDYPMGQYDVTIHIVRYEQDREVAWEIEFEESRIGHMYGYRLEPAGDGAVATSYYDWSAVSQEIKDAGVFPIIPESALKATLGILARQVAPGRPRPDA